VTLLRLRPTHHHTNFGRYRQRTTTPSELDIPTTGALPVRGPVTTYTPHVAGRARTRRLGSAACNPHPPPHTTTATYLPAGRTDKRCPQHRATRWTLPPVWDARLDGRFCNQFPVRRTLPVLLDEQLMDALPWTLPPTCAGRIPTQTAGRLPCGWFFGFALPPLPGFAYPSPLFHCLMDACHRRALCGLADRGQVLLTQYLPHCYLPHALLTVFVRHLDYQQIPTATHPPRALSPRDRFFLHTWLPADLWTWFARRWLYTAGLDTDSGP